MRRKCKSKRKCKSYIGINKNMILNGEQYEIGKVYHSTQPKQEKIMGNLCPLNFLCGTPPANSEYHEIIQNIDTDIDPFEAFGITISDDIQIGKKLSFSQVIEESIKFRRKYQKNYRISLIGRYNSLLKRLKSFKINIGAFGHAVAKKEEKIAAATGSLSIVENRNTCSAASICTGAYSVATVDTLGSAAVNTELEGIAVNTGSNFGGAFNVGQHGAALCKSKEGIAANSGDRGLAVSTNERSVAVNAGEKGAASTDSGKSIAANSGIFGLASNNGKEGIAANTGCCGIASGLGEKNISINTGMLGIAEAKHPGGIAITQGKFSMAKGAKGSVIIFVDFQEGNKTPKCHMYEVDGEKIKEDTVYTLKNDSIIEVLEYPELWEHLPINAKKDKESVRLWLKERA